MSLLPQRQPWVVSCSVIDYSSLQYKTAELGCLTQGEVMLRAPHKNPESIKHQHLMTVTDSTHHQPLL